MRKRARVAGNVAPLADFLSGAVAFVTVLRRGTSDAERAEAINASPSLSTCFSTGVGTCDSTAIETARRFLGDPTQAIIIMQQI